jgi:glucan phosphoethanolaminetransferase (alkaline phosphatase superfamily)
MIVGVFFYSLPVQSVFLHALLVYCLYALPLLFIQSIYPKPHPLKNIFFSTLSSMLVTLYSIDSLANHFWGGNVSINFIKLYVLQLGELLTELPYAPIVLATLLLIVWFCCWFMYQLTFAKILQKHIPVTLKTATFPLLVSLITGSFFYLTFSVKAPLFWEGEPISNLALVHTPASFTALANLNKSPNDQNHANNSIKSNKQANIILIHADALRADHMSAYGYKRETTPYLNSVLASGGHAINLGLSICSESICGMLAALGSNEVQTQYLDLPLLPSILKEHGYKTYLFGSGNFSWEGIDKIISPGFDTFVRADMEPDYSIHDDYMILDGLSKLPSNLETPSFFFLRYMSPHQVGKHFTKYEKYQPNKKNLFSYLFPELEQDTAINNYDNGILQFDDLLKQSLNILERKGYLANSIIVLYGDHGDAFGEHDYYGHYQSLYQEEIHVPIIFWGVSDPMLSTKDFATIMDIAPTILSMVKIEVPISFNGVSLLKNHEERITFHNSKRGVYAIVQHSKTHSYKLIYNTNQDNLTLTFDLNKDPSESIDITNKLEPVVVKKLKSQLVEHFQL